MNSPYCRECNQHIEIADLKAEIEAMRRSAIEVAKLLDPGIQAEMALHVEIATLRARAEELESKWEGSREDFRLYAINAGKKIEEAEFNLKMWTDRWNCSPYESIVQHDTLVAGVNALKAGLRECAQRVDDNGEPCWCCLDVMIPYRGHEAGCEAARALLVEPREGET